MATVPTFSNLKKKKFSEPINQMYLHLEAITIAEHCVGLLLQRKRELKNT